jgi:hypothetical protein
MDLKQLRAKGAFVKAPPVPTEVTWVHNDEETGEEMTDTFTVFVRRMSVGWLDRVLSPGPDQHRSRTATLISEGVMFGEGGKERMTYEEAYQLNFGLATALLEAFQRVNRKEEAGGPKA